MYMYIVRTYVFEYVVLCIATVAAPSLVQIHHAAKAYRSCALIRIVHEQILPKCSQKMAKSSKSSFSGMGTEDTSFIRTDATTYILLAA